MSMCRTHDSAHPDSRSRSQFKGFTLEFCVRSISPLPLEGFSSNVCQMFISVRQSSAVQRGIKFGLGLNLHLYFAYVSSEGSGKSALLHRFVWQDTLYSANTNSTGSAQEDSFRHDLKFLTGM